MYILVTYDISNDKQRKKVDKLLSEYGFRVNYSVFEIEIDTKTYTKLLQKLLDFVEKSDSVRVYRISKDMVEKSVELNPKFSHPFSKEDSYVL